LTTLLTELYALVLKALAIGYCILSGLDIEWFYSILYQRVKPPRPEGREFCLAAVLRAPVRKIDIFV
jgi:hypothetical protein